MKITQPLARLTMIESKARKAAFLREVVRALGLAETQVENRRFQEVVDRTGPQTIDLVTVRAIRSDGSLFTGIHRVLSPIGRVFLFQSHESKGHPSANFAVVERVRLAGRGGQLSILKPVLNRDDTD